MPHVELTFHEGVHVIGVESSYQERYLTTAVPGARYIKSLGHWIVPATWASCLVLRGVFGDRLDIGPQMQAWVWDTWNKRINPANILRERLDLSEDFPELDTIEKNSPLKLYDYQRVDVRLLTLSRQYMLANEPGLGKTGVLIRTLQILDFLGEKPFPAIVVCPNSLKFTVWKKELQTWAPELTSVVIDGTAVKRRKQLSSPADVYIINWDSLRLHSRIAPFGDIALTDSDKQPKELNELGHRTVIFDEIHRIKDPHSKQTRSSWSVAHQAEFRFGASGSLMADNIGDIWSAFHAILPAWFPVKTKFMERYALSQLNFFGGTEIFGINPVHKDELFKIVDPIMRRIPKKLALPQLPEKLPDQFRYTPMTAKQQKIYDQMKREMIADLDSGTWLVAGDFRVQFLRLLQITSSHLEINEDGKVKLTDPSPKIDDMIDLLEEMGDKPLVVAAVSRQLIDLAAGRLEKLGIRHGLITGAQSPEERAQAVEAFQNGRTRVILLTLGAGAEGITLTRADTMLFMQEEFREEKNIQARDRIYRIGQKNSVQIVKQIAPGTVEERRLEILDGKRVRIDEFMRDEETVRRLLS